MAQSEPKFIPKPGQTDYTNIRRAPVINCAVKYKDKILLVQRSSNMKFYSDCWSGIAGYLDDNKSVEEKTKEELKEEIGIDEKDIISIIQGEVFEWNEPKYNKVWITHPVSIELKTDKVKLDWEAQDYRWVKLEDIKKIDVLPSFNKVLGIFFKE